MGKDVVVFMVMVVLVVVLMVMVVLVVVNEQIHGCNEFCYLLTHEGNLQVSLIMYRGMHQTNYRFLEHL